MNTLLAWLGTYALHSTVLLVGVALLTRLVVRRDSWRDALWKAALLGGIVTATLQLAIDVKPLVGRWELAGQPPAPLTQSASPAPSLDSAGSVGSGAVVALLTPGASPGLEG